MTRFSKRNVLRFLIAATVSLFALFDGPLGAVHAANETTQLNAAASSIDEPISIRLKDVLLRVPRPYFGRRSLQELRGRVNDMDDFGFGFWMPDGRNIETSLSGNQGFRPQEPGRGKPAQDAYIVLVSSLRPTKLDEPGYVSPELAYHNQISSRLRPGSRYDFQEESFGLVRYWPQDEPTSKFAVEYRHKEGSDPQILLDCMVPDRWRMFPACSGRVHFVADGLAFFIVFPREEVAHWHEIVIAARDFYRTWKVSP